MRHLLTAIALAFLVLPVPRAPAAEPAEPPPNHAAAVAEALKGIDRLEYDEVWDRGARLRRLGPEAGEAIAEAMPAASERGRLVLARQLLDIRDLRESGGRELLALAEKASDRMIRVYAANSLGQCTALVGSRWLLEALEKAAEGEKDRLVLVALHRARGRLGDDRPAADSLMIIMRRSRGAVRKEAALALGEIGRAVLPEVRKELLLIFRNDPTGRADRALSIYRSTLSRNPLLTEVLRVISVYYDAQGEEAKKIERQRLVRAAVRGMVSSLDPFSGYMDPEESKQLTETLTGEYGGIGAYVNLVDGVFTIISPIYGGPAHKSGLRSMDRVLEVDGVKTTGEAMGKTISRLKGRPGTEVSVKIFRRGWREGRPFKITRARISVHSAFAEMLPGGIGYLRLVRFSPKAPRELRESIAKLQAAGMKGLIIDVRDNPGGYLLSAVQLADEFLPAGKVIVSSKGRKVRTAVHRSTGKGRYADLPLTVLINSGSASASEILAGSLRDHGRARLVGEKTYGKGSVQEPIHLRSEPGSLLKLTVAKYYLPGGECIHEKGIQPDEEVTGEDQVVPGWKYEELAKAANALESYALEAYKRQPELFRKLAEDDGGDPRRYPGLAEKVAELQTKAHISPEDARPLVRRFIRREAADDRKRRFVSNLEDDRQLQKAALVMLESLKLAGDPPAPYDRYARAFAEEARRRDAQASGRLGLPQEGKK
jgi:carboxyl-terminal processing protease